MPMILVQRNEGKRWKGLTVEHFERCLTSCCLLDNPAPSFIVTFFNCRSQKPEQVVAERFREV